MEKEVKEVSTANFTKEDAEKGKGLGIVSYLGLLALIPFLTEKENQFVIFHAKQGLNLCLIYAIAVLISWVSCFLLIGFILLPIVSLGFLVLMIIGIVNVLNGEAKELPIVGKYKLIK